MASYLYRTQLNYISVFFLSCILVTDLMPARAAETAPNSDQELDLETVVSAVQRNDPWLSGNQHSQDALESLSIAAGSLPDPKMSISLANLPSDTLDFGQEAMTQVNVGVAQMFPRGDSLAIRKKQFELMGSQYPYQREDRRAKIAVNASQLWLNAYQAQESIALIEKDMNLFEQLADVAQASYSATLGRTRQQDIIRAQLELTTLADRLTILKQQKEMFLEQLSEWLSDYFLDQYTDSSRISFPVQTPGLKLARQLPNVNMLNPSLYTSPMEVDPQILYESFLSHPVVKALEQKIKASSAGIELAKQKYKPEWGLSANYGYRDSDPMGNDRADLLSVAISFDLPLFTANRQDKEVQSAVSQTEAVKTEKWLLVRGLIASFEIARTQLARLNERQRLYQNELLPKMHEQAEASLTAYTNDDGDFAEAVRARIAELNANITALTIAVERQKTIIRLNYFFMADASEVIASSEHPIDKTGEQK